jgi:hypothetical protein
VYSLDEQLARWVLGELPPEDVPQLATDALQAGCGALGVAVLAGLDRPTRGEVEEELPSVLRHLGKSLPSRREAGRIIGNMYARQMVAGAVSPARGCQQLWGLAMRFWGDRIIVDQLAVFSQLEDEAAYYDEDRAKYEAAMIAEAQALLDRGGLSTAEGGS